MVDVKALVSCQLMLALEQEKNYIVLTILILEAQLPFVALLRRMEVLICSL